LAIRDWELTTLAEKVADGETSLTQIVKSKKKYEFVRPFAARIFARCTTFTECIEYGLELQLPSYTRTVAPGAV
jgi:hypothetical protein